MSDENLEPDAKGRPTPSRKDAEAERRRQMKQPLTRKEQAQRQRQARTELRSKQKDALSAGRGDHLPSRDRGPVKAFVRDLVDRRRNVAEYLLLILIFILLMSIFTGSSELGATIVMVLWGFAVIGTVVDEFVLIRTLKKELRERFPDESHKGTTAYAVLRSSQMRRFRLPKVAIERNGELRSRY